MTERITRSRNEKNTTNETPAWIKFAGAAAIAGAATFGIYKANEAPVEAERPQDSYTVYSLDQGKLSDSEYVDEEGAITPIGAALTIIDKRIQSRTDTPDLTPEQRMSLMNSANIAYQEFQKEHGVPQPSTVVAVYSGEFDGKPGVDWRVQLKTPEDTSEPGPSVFSEDGKQELPSYFNET
ncbi:hypothetical protein GII36_03865 [Candidatus Mycosynbacter amalyticus]|uniref:Uncharacterized protein n=1 Tax=Candidatus Mycosynbacter amalyticus TaxID=2665156 RepID=A0A857MK88_9BACT|nr:hypothetical protein [Candidatus Mycosynbacter amalyticus]QHN42973.1 hypothetical protein GII36_03865 [Candidatus Mycosynbacter amalyticus]